MAECHPGTNIQIVDSVPTSSFRCEIPNTKRYMKANQKTIKDVSIAAYQGDIDTLNMLLATGDENNLFNGDLNEHVTSHTALHMAATSGQTECVELLLKAKADPHVRERMAYGEDPEDGKTACQMAQERGWDDTADLLETAAKKFPYGYYVPVGPDNNAKVYDTWEWGKKPDKGWYLSRPGAARHQGLDPKKYGSADIEDEADDDEFTQAITAAPIAKPLPIGLLFPGQGSQYVKMMSTVKDLDVVKGMLKKAEEILNFDLLKTCLEGPESKLEETSVCQPAMFIAGLAAVEKLKADREEAVTRCQCMAGLSLGEYTALCAAGVFTFEEGLKLVKLRGEAMQEAAGRSKQLMLSVAGLEKAKLVELCAQAEQSEGKGAVCQLANELFPKGYSCSGTEQAVQKLQELSQKAGALQAKLIKASGAFHTSLMKPAEEKLARALDDLLPNMKPPRTKVYMNINGLPINPGTNPREIVELLKRQVTSPVLWEPSVRAMIKDGVSEFYEVGPMKQLKAMMKRIDSKVWGATANVEI